MRTVTWSALGLALMSLTACSSYHRASVPAVRGTILFISVAHSCPSIAVEVYIGSIWQARVRLDPPNGQASFSIPLGQYSAWVTDPSGVYQFPLQQMRVTDEVVPAQYFVECYGYHRKRNIRVDICRKDPSKLPEGYCGARADSLMGTEPY